MADYVEQQLGNYRLLKLIGQGGFANVYLAEHVYLKTSAAIKVLQVRLTHDALDKFLAEARTIAQLSHPHIVRVLDFGIEQDTPFLVMNYAPYGSLRLRHPGGSVLASSQILSYVQQMASALQYAHDRMIIHRDVKPGNMLVAENDTLMLSDFGLATTVQDQNSSQGNVPVHHTQTISGTATYMAPEQFNGMPSPASDQYALAVVVYEWLCGVPPFQGSHMSVGVQHLQTPPPSLREKAPSLAPAVEQVVFRALAKDPLQRFPSVQDFFHALEEAFSLKFAASAPSGLILKRPPLTPALPDSQRSLSGSRLFDYGLPTVADHSFAPDVNLMLAARDQHEYYQQQGTSGPFAGARHTSSLSQNQRTISRRKVMLAAAGIVSSVAILGGGTALFALSHRNTTSSEITHLTATPRPTSTPNVEATAQALVERAVSRPSVVALGTGRLDLFVRGADNMLWRRSYNGSWQNWESLGGPLAYDPVALSWDGERIDLFVRGADNTLQHRFYDGTWHAWESLGGSLASDPAAASWQIGHIDVFARGPDDALWHIGYDGTWHEWESRGGKITSSPAVVSWGPRRLDIFARGADDAVWHLGYDKKWYSWGSLGGKVTSAPAATTWGLNRLDVFARATNAEVQHNWYDVTGGKAHWHHWEFLGGQLAVGAAPAAASWGVNHIDLFARGPSRALQHTSCDVSWRPWSPLQ